MVRSSVTVGVDLSAQDAKTWLATIDWSDGQAHARLEPGVADSRILEAAQTAAKVGIDCPFGWPTAFTKYVSDHATNGVDPRARTARCGVPRWPIAPPTPGSGTGSGSAR
jgi:hypothetical protein